MTQRTNGEGCNLNQWLWFVCVEEKHTDSCPAHSGLGIKHDPPPILTERHPPHHVHVLRVCNNQNVISPETNKQTQTGGKKPLKMKTVKMNHAKLELLGGNGDSCPAGLSLHKAVVTDWSCKEFLMPPLGICDNLR